MARTEGRIPRAITDEEISAASGLSVSVVQTIQWLDTWDHMTVDVLRRFCVACHMDPCDLLERRRAWQYINKANMFSHLRRTDDWNLKWEPMYQIWAAAIARIEQRRAIK